jgi:hypothetical protein
MANDSSSSNTFRSFIQYLKSGQWANSLSVLMQPCKL